MISSENRFPLFGIMLRSKAAGWKCPLVETGRPQRWRNAIGSRQAFQPKKDKSFQKPRSGCPESVIPVEIVEE
jgi:hypothetical protein